MIIDIFNYDLDKFKRGSDIATNYPDIEGRVFKLITEEVS